MYRRDYFLKLMQQFAKMLSKLMGLKERGEMEEASRFIQDAYKDLFNTDREFIKSHNEEALVDQLKTGHKLSNEQLEILAKLIFEDADLVQEIERKQFYSKALYILEYLNTEQKLYSFEREELIKTIKGKL